VEWRKPSSVVYNGYTNQQIGSTYCSTVTIYGNVKQIIQIRRTVASKSPFQPELKLVNDTTEFNPKCVIIRGNLGLDTLDDDRYVSKYFDKYDAHPSKIRIEFDSTELQVIHWFDKNGDDIAQKLVSKKNENDSSFYLRERKELVPGKAFEFKYYKAKNSLALKEILTYNNKQLLAQVSDYSDEHRLNERVFISYMTFDKYGNWTKRTETRKNAKGITSGIVTTTRKITYY